MTPMKDHPLIIRTIRAFLLVLALPALASDTPSEPRSDWTATQTLWDSGSYAYDGVGHIISIGTDVYRYDKAGRLKRATAATPSSPANQQEFDYDRYGNLTSLQVTTAAETKRHGFAVDPDTNRLGLTCSGTVDGCFTGFYDPATGDQLGRHSANEYVWDPLGMLAELHTSRSERYVYDADGERILVIDDLTGSERYTLRSAADKVARVLSFKPATGVWTLDKDHVYRDAALIASFSGGQTAPDRHYHVDHLGSTRLVTDGSGFRLAIHTYWPFGPEAPGSETDSGQLKFTGHERDSSSGTSPGSDLDYMHARYYDANAARFLTVDPGGWDKRQPQTWNRYMYAENNPVLKIDPDGRDAEIASSSNVNAVKAYLTELMRRPSGRAQMTQIINDRNFKLRMETATLTSPALIQQSIRQKTAINATFGQVVPTGNVQQPAPNAPGQYVVTGGTMTFDPNAISKAHPDKTGTTTAGHELNHANALRTGGVTAMLAGDVPTSATGPAEQAGKTIAAEKPDMSKKDARKLVDQLIPVRP